MARILLVLPNQDQRQAWVRILSEGGHATCQSTSAGDAQARMATDQFDLLMLDPDLPDRNGFSFLSELRAARTAPKVVVINRHARVATTLKAKGLGADGIITMPFTRSEFFTTIDDAIAV